MESSGSLGQSGGLRRTGKLLTLRKEVNRTPPSTHTHPMVPRNTLSWIPLISTKFSHHPRPRLASWTAPKTRSLLRRNASIQLSRCLGMIHYRSFVLPWPPAPFTPPPRPLHPPQYDFYGRPYGTSRHGGILVHGARPCGTSLRVSF